MSDHRSGAMIWMAIPTTTGSGSSGGAGGQLRLAGVKSRRRGEGPLSLRDIRLSSVHSTFEASRVRWGNEWGNMPHRSQPIPADLNFVETALESALRSPADLKAKAHNPKVAGSNPAPAIPPIVTFSPSEAADLDCTIRS
jgi:hypothetical protein